MGLAAFLIIGCGLAAAHDPGLLQPLGDVPPMPCHYHVDQESVTVTSGQIPSWLRGTFFKAIYSTHINNTDATSSDPPFVPPANDIGAVLSVRFDGASSPSASFGFVGGTDYVKFCSPATANSTHFASAGAITINSACGPGRLCVVTALPEVPAMSTTDLVTVLDHGQAVPYTFNGSLGTAQVPSPPGQGPSFVGSGHMATDANGDTYGMVYIWRPVPSYRIYKIRNGTNIRTVFPDIPVSSQPGDPAGMPKYNHQAVAFTSSFVLMPEMPVTVDPAFNWTTMRSSFNPEGLVYWHVICKKTGEHRGKYQMPASFMWHNINAWENSTHLTVDVTWVKDQRAFDGFVEGKVFSPWPGKVARISMPNPNDAGPSNGQAVVRDLTSMSDPRLSTPEFGVVNPMQMWRAPTKHIWCNSVDLTLGSKPTSWTTTFRLDTETGEVLTWSPGPKTRVAAPLYIPRDRDQSPEQAAGVVIVLTLTELGEPGVVLLDGDSHQVVATMSLPVAPLPSFGLHSHWSEFPTSV